MTLKTIAFSLLFILTLSATLAQAEANPLVAVMDFGGLSIESEPSEATVCVDGLEVGVTPLTLKEVAVGQHELLVQKKRYRQYVEKFNITPGETQNISAKLKPDFGVLVVHAKPDKVEVDIDGLKLGIRPPLQIELDIGRHTVTFRSANYLPFEQEVEIQSGQKTEIGAELQRDPDYLRRHEQKAAYNCHMAWFVGSIIVAAGGAVGFVNGYSSAQQAAADRDAALADYERARTAAVGEEAQGIIDDADRRGGQARKVQAISLGILAVGLGSAVWSGLTFPEKPAKNYATSNVRPLLELGSQRAALGLRWGFD